MAVKMICFDMDGTIANLCGINNWEKKLRKENPSPYRFAKPLVNMKELRKVLIALQAKGIEIRVITWLSMNSSERYKREVRMAKQGWLEKYHFPCEHFHGVAYGFRKHYCVRKYLNDNEEAILIDDNQKVRELWTLGATVNPCEVDIVEYLKTLL